ncbi:MAG: hypothetical protein JHC93_03720 [Parachlamydiales bacterium]|nr:hypothetical protein [Parachlamydiales bacterium]
MRKSISNLNQIQYPVIGSINKSPTSEIKGKDYKCAKSTVCYLQNRGGLGEITESITTSKSDNLIDRLYSGIPDQIEVFSLSVGEEKLNGFIYYPKNWNKEDKTQCVVFNNPVNCTIESSFQDIEIAFTPKRILSILKCPILFYNYRVRCAYNCTSSPKDSKPTYDKHIEDAESVLNHALSRFKKVHFWGICVAGSIATIALANHIEAYPDHHNRVVLESQDAITSITTSANTKRSPLDAITSTTTSANTKGSPLSRFSDKITKESLNLIVALKDVTNKELNVTVALKSLVQAKVKTLFISYTNDPEIPQQNRLSEFAFKNYFSETSVSFCYTDEKAHGVLTNEMAQTIQSFSKFLNR